VQVRARPLPGWTSGAVAARHESTSRRALMR
jgi:hypothetical protein